MVPGAKVEVTVGGTVRGSGLADNGSARIALSAPTGAADILVAKQTACGTAGLPTPLPKPDTTPLTARHLAAPKVGGPLRACQRAVSVENVVDGALVTLSESPGFTESAGFDLPSLWFPTPALTLGANVSAIETMPGCKLTSVASAAVPVGPSTPVPSPSVVPPLCAGSVSVRLTNVLPGSVIEIFQGATSLGTGSAPASTFDFQVPPLSAGAIITARQELCGNWSSSSNEVKVDTHPAALPTPTVASPLYDCGAAVHVSNLHPGATVYVYSTLLGAPVGSCAVFATAADVLVSPQLIAGDHIYAVQHGCGLVSSKSVAVAVTPLPKLVPPTVLPVVETCMKSVTVGNVLPGAHVDVYVNAAWQGSAIATATTVEVPILFTALQVGDSVTARQIICEHIVGPGAATQVVSSAGYYYLTQHFDVARTGWFPYETHLTVGNVPSLKKLFSVALTKPDGTADNGSVYAQPLVAHHVNIGGAGAHNVVFVATESDVVYAFDADTNQPPLWTRSLIPTGEQVVSVADIAGCNNVDPVIGITSTPVIDCATHTMYVVAKTKKVSGSTTSFHYRLSALDMSNGADRMSPVEIAGSVPGTADPNDGHGHVVFDPQWHLNRPGLLLLNGVIYIGFGSHCDAHLPLYHGWVFGYNATTLAQVGAFATTPTTPSGPTSAAGIWQGGMGLAADPQGFIYFTTGNGNFTANMPGMRDYGDTVVKLKNDFSVPDYFTPSYQPTLLTQDIDLGSGGVLILPDPASNTKLISLLVACGKDGNVLLINRNKMGEFTPGGPDKLVQVPPLQLRPGANITDQSGVWGGPAYYQIGRQQFVYYCGNRGPMKAYVLSGNALSLSMIGGNPNQSPHTFPSEGGATPNVSSNQQTAGTGVLWAITRSNPLHLQAFDAANLTHQLIDLPCGSWHNGNGGAFIEPTVIQGKVYVASDGLLTVFGV